MPIHQWTGAENEWDVRDLKEAQDVAKAVSKASNHMGNTVGPMELASQLANDHPTLQQRFMVVALQFIVELANKPYVDARNQASYDLAKKIVPLLEPYRFHDTIYLPFI